MRFKGMKSPDVIRRKKKIYRSGVHILRAPGPPGD